MTRGAGWLLAALAALALLVTAGTGSAAKPQRIVVEKAPVLPARVTDGQGKQVTDSPPHASTTGTSSRSEVAGRQGANNPRFCPPGQKKKAGKGSAFNC